MDSPVRLNLKRTTARLSRALLFATLIVAWWAPATSAEEATAGTAVVFSYRQDWIEQTIEVSDLEGEQFWEAAVWAIQTASGPDRVGIEVTALDTASSTVQVFSSGLQIVGTEWGQISVSAISDLSAWSTIRLRIYGKDGEFWGGNYGPRVDDVSLWIGEQDESARIANASFEITSGFSPESWASSQGWNSCQGLYTATLCLASSPSPTPTTTTTSSTSSTTSSSEPTSSTSEAPTSSSQPPETSEAPSTSSEAPSTSQNPPESNTSTEAPTTVGSTWPPTTESTIPTTTATTTVPIVPVPASPPTTVGLPTTVISTSSSMISTTSQPEVSEPPPTVSSTVSSPETTRAIPSTVASPPPVTAGPAEEPEATFPQVVATEPMIEEDPLEPSPTTQDLTTTSSSSPDAPTAPPSDASEEEKRAFEEEVNIFSGAFDNYIPSGSNVTVAQRRTIVAVTAVVSTITPVSTTRRRGQRT